MTPVATGSTRSFRFALQLVATDSRTACLETARVAEDCGFDTVVVPDHVVDGALAPLAALGTIADATNLRVGTLVLNNDFRHPALVAREAVTVDLLSDGRLELGLGAGHAAPEYAQLGLPFDAARTRVERLGEALEVVTRLFGGETLTFAGAHYRIDGHALLPLRRPTILVGGNGDTVLRLAARYADIVGMTGLGRTLPDGKHHRVEWEPEQIDAKVATVRAAAGDRLPDLEIQALVQHVEITNDGVGAATGIASRVGVRPEAVLASPYVMLGTVDEIVEHLLRCRTRWGFSYFVTRDARATAPVIAALRSVS